jgi:hypothetical protein
MFWLHSELPVAISLLHPERTNERGGAHLNLSPSSRTSKVVRCDLPQKKVEEYLDWLENNNRLPVEVSFEPACGWRVEVNC